MTDKRIVLILVIMFILCLFACAGFNNNKGLYFEPTIDFYTDQETGQEYIIVYKSDAVAITPRLNAYGGTGKVEEQ